VARGRGFSEKSLDNKIPERVTLPVLSHHPAEPTLTPAECFVLRRRRVLARVFCSGAAATVQALLLLSAVRFAWIINLTPYNLNLNPKTLNPET